eukprot:13672297-Alexandrium_andersonii.AAC.1
MKGQSSAKARVLLEALARAALSVECAWRTCVSELAGGTCNRIEQGALGRSVLVRVVDGRCAFNDLLLVPSKALQRQLRTAGRRPTLPLQVCVFLEYRFIGFLGCKVRLRIRNGRRRQYAGVVCGDGAKGE